MSPFLIITAGATGSGKTDLIKNTADYLGVDASSFHKTFIDDLIESDERYVAATKDIVEEVDRNCESDVKCEENAYLNPTAELFKKFESAYYKSRDTKGCNGNADFSCGELLDRNLKDHFSKDDNVIFETTGERMPGGWILNSDFTPPHYTVVISYSLVDLNALVERNKMRGFSSVKKFKQHYSAPAPRLPDVSQERFIKVLNNTKNSLIDLYKSCIQAHKAKCGHHKVDRLLIFDNNETSTIVFDSDFDTKTLFNKIMSASFPVRQGPSRRAKPFYLRTKSYLRDASKRRFGNTKKRVRSSRTVSASQSARIGTLP